MRDLTEKQKSDELDTDQGKKLLDDFAQFGVPVVLFSKTPDSISTLSASFLAVVSLFCPGFLRSNSF